ncbi:MAG: hypothetical protein FJ102_25675 [Deltaproteobacteria bacterium]|nr:hypothetical protein [Deltaproteobacteria bacterium]
MLIGLLLACWGVDTGTTTVEVADYVLNLRPVVPDNQSPFDDLDRLDLVLSDGTSDPVRISLDPPGTGGSAAVEKLPALFDTRITVEGYELGQLVAWGRSNAVTASTGEVDVPIYVATPGKLGRLGPLEEATAWASGVALGNGRFAIFGGFGSRSGGLGEAVASTAVYDLGAPNDDLVIDSDAFTVPSYTDANGETQSTRGGASLTLLTSGDEKGLYLYAGGGDTEPVRDGTTITPDVRYFDASTLEFSEPLSSRDALSGARSMHSALANLDGSVLAWGGWGVTSSRNQVSNLTTGEIYDPADKQFRNVSGPSEAGGVASSLADLGDSGTMVCGGIHVDDYDDDDVAEWKLTDTCFRVTLRGEDAGEIFAGLPKIAAQALVALPDGDVLSFGGIVSAETIEFDDTAPATAAVYRYYHGSQTWTQVGTMSLPRANATAVLLDDKTVVVAGGSDAWGPSASDAQALSCVEVYDTLANTSELVQDCDEDSDNGGLPNRAERPLALFDEELGVLFAGGQDGDNGAEDGASLFLYPPD